MKKVYNIAIIVLLLVILTGCGCQKKGGTTNPSGNVPTTPAHHFNYDKEMFDNPSDWPTGTFFDNLPSVASRVDDLTITNVGSTGKQIYTFTMLEMSYESFKDYAERLIDEGYMCVRASYWLPDKESGLSSNYSQCVADKDGVYIKAYWYKPSAQSYSFQMSVANFNMDA